ncbi:MAG: RraA family protein [Desulfovibrio sp.]|jgi:regulator of RNase E activity RraA|nr:RraA family protein [Desulfovibrio sp.]
MRDSLRLHDSVIERYKKLDTTSVSDAVDKAGLPPCGLLHIRSTIPGAVLCGQAFTVHYVPCGMIAGTVGDFLDEVEPGQVVVIDNAGRDYCTVWGDIMSLTAQLKHISGTVIDGVCRDIPSIRRIGYPVFSKGCYMVTGKDRVYVDAVETPVSVSGVQVKPGDIIMADDSGAICVPLEKAPDVLELAENIANIESAIEELVRAGIHLKEARKRTGYHTLQTKDKF